MIWLHHVPQDVLFHSTIDIVKLNHGLNYRLIDNEIYPGSFTGFCIGVLMATIISDLCRMGKGKFLTVTMACFDLMIAHRIVHCCIRENE